MVLVTVRPGSSRVGAALGRRVTPGLAAVLFVAACSSKEPTASWDSVRKAMVEQGASEEAAQCVVSRLRAESDEVPDLDKAGSATPFLKGILECQVGVPGSIASCMVEEAGQIWPDANATMRDLVALEASLDAQDREVIAEASLRCQGASAEVAACVTDGMRREFGEDVFASKRLELSTDDQARLAAIATKCAEET